MAEADLRVVTQIGEQYVAICDQFLTEQLGRPYTMPEIVQFAETAISTLLASAYANFREAMGKEASEAWLKKTLALSGATTRKLGADALLRFEVHIKDAPNKLAKQRQEMQAQPTKAPETVEAPKCTCPLDKDGACVECVNALSEGFRNTFQFMRKMAEFGKKNEKLQIVGGGLSGTLLDAASVRALAELPSLDQLRGKLIGLLNAPASRLAGLLQAPGGQVARALAARAEQLGG